jgi:hypothetical protein
MRGSPTNGGWADHRLQQLAATCRFVQIKALHTD